LKLRYLLLAAFSLTSLGKANLIVNPGFEEPVLRTGILSINSGNTGAVTGWTATGNCASTCGLLYRADYTIPTNVGDIQFTPHGGLQSYDVTGNGNVGTSGVQQTVTLTPGILYTLSFWLSNMDNRASNYALASSIEVLINGQSFGVFSNNNSTNLSLNWLQVSFNFVPVIASNTILFSNATPVADYHAGLDDVFLDVAVPEPGSLGMLLVGLAAATCLRKAQNGRR